MRQLCNQKGREDLIEAKRQGGKDLREEAAASGACARRRHPRERGAAWARAHNFFNFTKRLLRAARVSRHHGVEVEHATLKRRAFTRTLPALPKIRSMDELVVALSGSVGQVVGTLCVFPIDVLKTRLQASERAAKSVGLASGLLTLLREEGFGILRLFPIKARRALPSYE